ncbi:EAL domain-containing protein [Pontibacterium granulatum]|uniref:putative bifunctional diguanylate cyclase/phosphodiesterase n=1 Tax=Pontibacterium granulatum TaxID=2036029 RepID=UPI00249C47B0|nr:EAL domain-containing protein [Pontibacterium granulatum]MDI3324315.1 EAL domain-containing protein [Pontibacterium granulatum]
MKHSIATRYGILLAVMTALVGCCVLLVNIFYLERYAHAAIDEGQQHLTEAVEKQLIRDAQLVAESLASNLDAAVYSSDFSAIQEQLEALSHNTNVAYTYIHDASGRVIHDGSAELHNFGRHISELLPPGLPVMLDADTRKIGQYIHVAQPIRSGETTFAVLRIAITYTEAETDIREMSADLALQSRELRNNIIVTSLSIIILLLASAMALVFFLSQHLLSPIRRLVDHCRRYTAGENQIRFKLERADEFGLLGDALEEMKDSINLSRSQVERLAYHDALTQLPNRRMFNEELNKMLSWADRHNNQVAVLFIDLDHFKRVNDVAGHEVGDKLLIQAANRLTNLLVTEAESIDFPVPESLLLARLGGDEFVMMLPNCKDRSQISRIATRIADVLDHSFTIEDRRYTVSASVGITLFPEHGRSVTELLKQADIAMYAAKHSGRKRHRFFEPQMNNEVISKMLIQQDVRDAMQRGELKLAYQPIVDIVSNEIIGAEALLRWEHPEQGPIAPDTFIPLIEKTDQIMPLTLWTLEHACHDLIQQIIPRRSHFKLSVNISGAVLREPAIQDAIHNIIQRAQLPAHTLHLELTETSMMENIQSCADTLQAWKQMGAAIWIDDFGTGYSSLSYLHSLPIDGLKIDRSFIAELDQGQGDQVIETIITMANAMGLKTVCEGIETESQQHFVHNRGGDYAQGYLYAKPAPLKQLLKLLDKETLYEPL